MQRSINALTGLVAAMLALGCSSTKNPLPPPFVGSAIDNPVSCAQLQNGQIVGKEIHLDGGIPNCGATGIRCPLPDVPASTRTGVCGSRNIAAMCELNQWKLVCEAPVDASAPADAGDAGDAAAPDAQADASPD